MKHRLTAVGRFPPALHLDVAVAAAGPGVGLQVLALETIHCRIFAQRVCAGGYEGLWVDVLVASSEGSPLQEITPVQGNT